MVARLNAYTSRNPDGGVRIDMEGIVVDLITVCKAGGITEEMLIEKIRLIWPEVHVTISIPTRDKN